MEKEAEGEQKEARAEGGGGGGMAEEEYLMIFTDLTECRCRGAGVKAMRVCGNMKHQLIVNLN